MTTEIAGLVERAENYQHLARDSEPAHIIGQLVDALTRLEAERDEADYANISWCIRMADIREASGVGVKPMLDDVPTAIRARIAGIEAARDEAIKLMGQHAREAGEAKGRLEMSEAAGIVDGWRERAEKAEQLLSAACVRLADYARTISEAEARASRAEALLGEAVGDIAAERRRQIDVEGWTGESLHPVSKEQMLARLGTEEARIAELTAALEKIAAIWSARTGTSQIARQALSPKPDGADHGS